MKATNTLKIRLVATANLTCLAILVQTGCKTVTRVEKKPLETTAARTIPIEMTARQSIPTATQAAILYARNLEKHGNLTEAANIYEQLLAEQNDNPVALHRLAVINSQMGDFIKAEEYFHRVVSLDQDNAEVLCDLGFNCFLQDKLIDAEKSYLAALNVDGDLKRLHNNLAVVYARTDRADLALAQFRAAGCDPVTARKNLFSVTSELHRNSGAPSFPDHSRTTKHAGALPESSTGVPIINFSSPSSDHISNPLAAEQGELDDFVASESSKIAQVANWEPSDKAPPATEASSQQPSSVNSSRRTSMK